MFLLRHALRIVTSLWNEACGAHNLVHTVPVLQMCAQARWGRASVALVLH